MYFEGAVLQGSHLNSSYGVSHPPILPDHGLLTMVLQSLELHLSYDPNWYLSTIVQSTAALTAILGGFLISRVISLALRRNELSDRKSYLQTRLNGFTQERDRLLDLINQRVHKIFLGQQLEEIIWTLNSVDTEKILDDSHYIGSNEDDLRIYLQEVIDLAKDAIRQLEELFPSNQIPTDVQELRSAGLILQKWDEVEIYTNMAIALNKKRGRNLNPALFTPQISSLKPQALTGERTNRFHDDRIKRRDELDFQINFLLDEIQLVDNQGNSKISSKMLNQGLLILAYFGGASIGFPLVVMSRNPVRATGTQRDFVLVLFSTGFVWMGTFIFRAIRNLDNV